MSNISLSQYNRAETPTIGSTSGDLDEQNYVPETSWIRSPTRWFQVFMFVAFVVTLTCALTAKYDNLSPGILWGSGLSFFAVIFVMISYSSEPRHRRHPNPLIFWRTIADFIFVVRLIAEQFVRCVFYNCDPICNRNTFDCATCHLSGSSSTVCVILAGILEFSLIASECWFVCMSVNLYFSLTNPFTDFKRNTKAFHCICWGTGLLLAILLMGIDDIAGKSALGFCWTNAYKSGDTSTFEQCYYNTTTLNLPRPTSSISPSALKANFPSWFFFYIWMVVFIIYGLGVWLWAWRRLSEGTPETYAVRVQSINRARFYVFSVTLYWVTVVIVYVAYLVRDASKGQILFELMNFLLASKGYLDFVVWFALNDFEIPKLKNICRRDIVHVDVDLSPQVNAALRREVLFYTTSGIIQAVHAAERLPESQRIQHLALLPQVKETELNDGQTSSNTTSNASTNCGRKSQRTKTFHDYEPHAFRRIRERFGVDNDRYLKSLSTTAKERLSEGASGAFMFFSGDGSLIVKSTSKEECRFLRSIADAYAKYLCNSPNSLLTRFYGCHCLELYGQQFSFVVMANLFDTKQVIHSRYDIKGSWVNRNADLPKKGKKVTCRHCNRKYIYQSNQPNDLNCPLRLVGHEPNVVLKDNDLTQKLRLDEGIAWDLFQQLKADSNMLCNFGIMDYSLLLGIHDVEYMVEADESKEEIDEAQISAQISLHPKGSSVEETYSLSNSSGKNNSSYNPYCDSSVMNSSTCDPSLPPSKPLKQQEEQNVKAKQNRPSTTTNNARKAPRGGLRMANTVVGPAYYHIGIIDILQTWTFKKQIERKLKVYLKGLDGDGLSAIPPKIYRERFHAKMADILGVQGLIESEQRLSDHVYIQQNSRMDLEPSTSTHGVQLLRPVSAEFRSNSKDGNSISRI